MPAAVSVNHKLSIKTRFKSLDLRNSHAIVLSARQGVRTEVFYDFAKAIKMPEKMLANIINLSARTISNYNGQQKVLAPVHAEHLLKLISLYEKGEEIFGNTDEFNYWLKKPFWNSKETPFDLIITPGGVDLLIEELDKLAHGYPV